ncbi:MAG: DUF4124 domain-containing protein [Gallionellaceae bacterium]|nr:DUF4124 domain-containing protein [Gallionellaceae bacterium]
MKYELPIHLLLLGLVSFSAYSAVNKWVDDKGQVHYSDQPPPADTRATTLINISTASDVPASGVSASGVSAPKSVAEREAEYKKAQKAKADAERQTAKQKDADTAKQKYCEDLRNNLKLIEDSGRIAAYDAKGERYYLDDAARQQRIETVRQSLQTNCN